MFFVVEKYANFSNYIFAVVLVVVAWRWFLNLQSGCEHESV